MERSVAAAREGAPGAGPGRQGPGARRALGLAALVVLLALALVPGGLAAQQDTIPPDSLAADTLAQDTTLTVRERAIRRLRALRIDPVQPDTTRPDSAAADSLRADSLRADSAGAAMGDTAAVVPGDTAGAAREDQDRLGGRVRRPDPLDPRAGREPPRGVREVEDTVILADPGMAGGEDRVLAEDSVLALLRSLEGYTATEYSGESAVFQAGTNQLELSGESRVAQAPNAMTTDSLLVYDGESGIVCGYGAPVLSGENDPIESDEVCFNIERKLGVASGARTQFQQGATWYVRGADNRVYLLTGGEKNAMYGERAEFTSCDLDHPHYTFEAKSLKMVEDEMMVARNITLQFEDVPVFWLPWMVQSMKRGRRSGLLMPEFGVNDIVRNSTGYSRHLSNLGFYWAINDYVSAKGTFEWFSGNWTAVEGALTYRWLRQFLRGSLIARQYWRQREGVPSSREFTLNTSNSWQPDERTRVQANANYATSTDFIRRNSFDPDELTRKITSSASVNRQFDWGSMSVGADRSQQLSTGRVDMKLPGVNLTISPITLFAADDGGLRLTWNGSGRVARSTVDVPDTLRIRDSESMLGSYSHSLSLGKLGLSQSFNWSEEVLAARPALTTPPDTVALPEESDATLAWSTSLSYQQVLWPGTTLSPRVSISENRIRDARTDSLTGGGFVAQPYRLSAGASLNTAIYGFWPGFGNFSRIRHKISPSVRWTYSPTPTVTDLQRQVFDPRNLRESNEISLSFNQTFEAKVREEEPAPGDTAAVDSTSEPVQGRGRAGGAEEPRRLAQAEKVLLLSLDTRTSFVYDFVAAREEGRGFETDRISNSIRSDLLQGLQLTMTHSLFDYGEASDPDALRPRTFDPFLTELSTSFNIDSDFWLFDFLGLTADGDAPAGPGRGAGDEALEAGAGEAEEMVGAEASADRAGGVGPVVPTVGAEGAGMSRGGGWRARIDYSLTRARPGSTSSRDNQLLRGSLNFNPTEKWSVSWRTAYSFTDGEFANHVLTLSRDLHRWQANFDFIKAQNGNFLMSFRVQLRDNPDLKLDYDQRSDVSGTGSRSREIR